MLPRRRSRAGLSGDQRRGAVTLEFALLFPIFFLLAVGILEFGRVIQLHTMVNDAARQGARAASLEGSNIDEVRTKVVDSLTAVGISEDSVTLQVTPTNLQDAITGTRVTVSVAVPLLEAAWVLPPRYVDSDLTVEAACNWRHE